MKAEAKKRHEKDPTKSVREHLKDIIKEEEMLLEFQRSQMSQEEKTEQKRKIVRTETNAKVAAINQGKSSTLSLSSKYITLLLTHPVYILLLVMSHYVGVPAVVGGSDAGSVSILGSLAGRGTPSVAADSNTGLKEAFGDLGISGSNEENLMNNTNEPRTYPRTVWSNKPVAVITSTKPFPSEREVMVIFENVCNNRRCYFKGLRTQNYRRGHEIKKSKTYICTCCEQYPDCLFQAKFRVVQFDEQVDGDTSFFVQFPEDKHGHYHATRDGKGNKLIIKDEYKIVQDEDSVEME